MTEPLAPTVPACASPSWQSGQVSIAVVMISLNEAHNMASVLENLKGFAQEVFLVDSYSSDETVDIALENGVYVVQRKFRGFGDQWNFAMRDLPITASWTMKLDPDERLSDELKEDIGRIVSRSEADAFTVQRRLWFMGRQLPVMQVILRGWKTGTCRFSSVLVNEHPLVQGRMVEAAGILEHHDSPTLHHWVEKQNHYTTAEALAAFEGMKLSAAPRLLGTQLERRMWLKHNFDKVPMRFLLLYMYNLVVGGAWRAGKTGWIWARLRVDVHRMREYKFAEMRRSGRGYAPPKPKLGSPHPGAHQTPDNDEEATGSISRHVDT